MQTTNLDMGYLLRIEPKAAVDYLKSKGYRITWDWHEQLEEAQVKALTVAKATRMEILETIRKATEEAIQNGVSERDFIANLTPKLQQLGWWGKAVDENGKVVRLGSPHRLKTIYRTNKSVAYHAGRYARQMENIDEQPYWQYIAVNDARTRASHLSLHNKIYRADDPIWETIYPPNDWGCRCRVRALSEFKVQREGLKIDSSNGQLKAVEAVAGVNSDTGEEVRVEVTQVTTDKGTMKTGAGWNYNVGLATYGSDINVIRKLQQVQNRELRQQTIQAINHNRERHNLFANWVKAHLGKRGASDKRFISAGLVTEQIAQAVEKHSGGKKLAERLLIITEKGLEHANSPKHHNDGIGLSAEEYAGLSRIIASPDLVVWDKDKKNLIYFDTAHNIKIVVDAPSKINKAKEKVDAIINAYRVDMNDVKAAIVGGKYEVIEGSVKN